MCYSFYDDIDDLNEALFLKVSFFLELAMLVPITIILPFTKT